MKKVVILGAVLLSSSVFAASVFPMSGNIPYEEPVVTQVTQQTQHKAVNGNEVYSGNQPYFSNSQK